MLFLTFAEIVVITFLVFELLFPAIRGTQFFPILHSLRYWGKIAEVNSQIDNEKLEQDVEDAKRKLKKVSRR